MVINRIRWWLLIVCVSVVLLGGVGASGRPPRAPRVDWSHVVRVSRTTPTLQVVVNPPLRRGSPIHDRVFTALQNLQADYVRFVPWFPYPRLGVAELEPPTKGKTFWDFSLIDPLVLDFLHATEGHSRIVNFSTIPEWMFVTPQKVLYPSDPNEACWTYRPGTELRDPSMKELAGYYARLVSWYTRGGFRDELGRWHESGYHFRFPYWEVLNEVESEHSMSPKQYTERYDAIVEAIRRVAPEMKFVGLALEAPSREPEYFEYFLDHSHHQPGIPLDMISYHFYAVPTPGQTLEVQQYTFFEQAERFLATARYIEAIRMRLSPETRTTIDEVGTILATPQKTPTTPPIDPAYWNLSGATFAYVFGRLSEMGIDVVGESQLVGFPTQFPSVSMVDWNTGQPNARYWVLKLLRDQMGPGDRLVATDSGLHAVYALGYLKPGGARKLLLVNKRARTVELSFPGLAGGTEEVVDQQTGSGPPATARLKTDTVTLGGFAVAVVSLP